MNTITINLFWPHSNVTSSLAQELCQKLRPRFIPNNSPLKFEDLAVEKTKAVSALKSIYTSERYSATLKNKFFHLPVLSLLLVGAAGILILTHKVGIAAILATPTALVILYCLVQFQKLADASYIHGLKCKEAKISLAEANAITSDKIKFTFVNQLRNIETFATQDNEL